MNKPCSDFSLASAVQSLPLGDDLAHSPVALEFWRRTSGKSSLRFHVENNKANERLVSPPRRLWSCARDDRYLGRHHDTWGDVPVSVCTSWGALKGER